MTHLDSSEVVVLLAAVERAHMVGMEEKDFYERMFGILEDLIPGSLIVAQEFNLQTKAACSCTNRTTPPEIIARCAELIPSEHPMFPLIKAGTREVLRLSDFCTLRQMQRTALFHDIFRPLGVRYEIVLPLELQDHVAGLTLSRDRDFSDEEVRMAQLLAPHIALAHTNSQYRRRKTAQSDVVFEPEHFLAFGLTGREAEVLHWIIQGKRDGEIAQILALSVRTVEKHVQSILSKMGAETRTGAAMEAIRQSAKRA